MRVPLNSDIFRWHGPDRLFDERCRYFGYRSFHPLISFTFHYIFYFYYLNPCTSLLVPQLEDQLEYRSFCSLPFLPFPLDCIVRDHNYGNTPSLDPLPAPTGTSSDSATSSN